MAFSFAQAAETLRLNYTYLQPSEGDLEGEVEQHEFKASGSLKVLPPEEYVVGLAVGGAFQANLWDFDDDRFDTLRLYKVKVPVTATYDVTEKVPVDFSLVPGLHSDLKDVDEDDFRMEGSVVGSYTYSKTLKFRFGLAYGEEFGDPEFFPVGGVMWSPTDAVQVDILLPSPKISYALSEDARVFISGEPAGGEWNVGEDRDEQIDVQQKGYRLGLGAEYQVVEGGWLFAMLGKENNREISLAVDEDTVVDDRDLDDATFVQIGFRLQ